MLTLHTAESSNGRKPLIALEELALAYEVVVVDLSAGAQDTAAFRALNPLGRIPVLVDDDVGPVFESNAILWHLATKTSRLIGEGRNSVKVMEWLFLQGASADPAITAYARLRDAGQDTQRAQADADRVLAALETHLSANKYVAGEFSIADIAFQPQLHLEMARVEHAGKWPAIRGWMERCYARPSVEKGLTMRIA